MFIKRTNPFLLKKTIIFHRYPLNTGFGNYFFRWNFVCVMLRFTMKPSFLETLTTYLGEGLISDPNSRKEKTVYKDDVAPMSLSRIVLECEGPRVVLPATSPAHPGMFVSVNSFHFHTGYGLGAINAQPNEGMLGLDPNEVPSNMTNIKVDGFVLYDIVTHKHIINASFEVNESYPLVPSLLYWNVGIHVHSVELVGMKVSLESIAEVWPPVWNYIYVTYPQHGNFQRQTTIE